jgi:hypothetical protein
MTAADAGILGFPEKRQARARSGADFEALVSRVEWTLVKMPLPKLQRLGNHDTRLLYVIDWANDVRERRTSSRPTNLRLPDDAKLWSSGTQFVDVDRVLLLGALARE